MPKNSIWDERVKSLKTSFRKVPDIEFFEKFHLFVQTAVVFAGIANCSKLDSQAKATYSQEDSHAKHQYAT